MIRYAYQYAVLRCVPRPQREEFVNVGVVLYCQELEFLEAAWEVDRERAAALWSGLDVEQVCATLTFVSSVCAGDAGAGEAARRPRSQRFGFLKAPKSTVVQPGPVHGGLTRDPAATLDLLVERLVR